MSLRAELLATARELPRRDLVTGTQGNASVRADDGILITPSALPYNVMTAADIVRIDLDGNVLDGARPPSSEWRVHVAIYAARPDVAAIVHTHSRAATSWSRTGEALGADPATPGEHPRGEPLGDVHVAPFAPTGTAELGRNAVAALGVRRAVLLAEHGVVAVGRTLAEALDVAVAVEDRVTHRTQA